LFPEKLEILKINCSGKAFTIPRSTLCSLEDSKLAAMFSDEHIGNIPKDGEGNYFVDFNPVCFAIIVDYLRNLRLRRDAPLPPIPAAQQDSMDLLAEALNLTPFMKENKVAPIHKTSLYVTGTLIKAMHPGWQVISAANPLPQAKSSYFEVRVLEKSSTSGGLAIGVCGHIPSGDEVHSIHLSDSILYNSHNGLIGDSCDINDGAQKVELKKGDVFGVRCEILKRGLIWYHNGIPIGDSRIKEEFVEKMKAVYPVFAIYSPPTMIQVDFKAKLPED